MEILHSLRQKVKTQMKAMLQEMDMAIVQINAPNYISNWLCHLDLDFSSGKLNGKTVKNEEYDEEEAKLSDQFYDWCYRHIKVEDIKLKYGYYIGKQSCYVEFKTLEYFKGHLYYESNDYYSTFVDAQGSEIDIQSMYPATIPNDGELVRTFKHFSCQDNFMQLDEPDIIKYIMLAVFKIKIEAEDSFDYTEKMGYTG